MRHVVDVDMWLDFLDCIVLEEHRIYGLDVPCCLVCTLMVIKNALVSLFGQLQIDLKLVCVLPSADPARTSWKPALSTE